MLASNHADINSRIGVAGVQASAWGSRGQMPVYRHPTPRRAWTSQKWMSIAVLLLAVSWPGRVSAQDKKTETVSDSTKSRASGELILDEIQIEGVVGKPNVTILRNRVASDFGAVEFEQRTFDRELRALPDKRSLFDEEFESVKKVGNLKKALEEMLKKMAD